MIAGLEASCKARLRRYYRIFLEGLRKITKPSIRIAGVAAGIRTEHIPNMTLERYRSAHLFRHAHTNPPPPLLGRRMMVTGTPAQNIIV
jgi:hypothetical protein